MFGNVKEKECIAERVRLLLLATAFVSVGAALVAQQSDMTSCPRLMSPSDRNRTLR